MGFAPAWATGPSLQKLLRELLKLCLERRDFRAQGGDLGLERLHSAGLWGGTRRERIGGAGLPAALRLGGEKLDVAALLLAGLLGQELHERGIAAHEALQAGLQLLDGCEMKDTLGAGAQLPGGLRSAQEENAEDGDVAAIELEELGQIVPVLLDARA